MNVLTVPDPRLRQKSSAVSQDWEKKRIEDYLYKPLCNAMRKYSCLGFSSPQLAMPFRAIYVGNSFGIFLMNPEIIETTGTQFSIEGCLSLPPAGKTYRVERPEKIVVMGEDLDRRMIIHKASGKDAWIFCHEIDHLDGIMIDVKGERYG